MSIPRWSDGAGVGTVADSNVVGGIPVEHIFNITDAATNSYDIVLTHKTEITDVLIIKTGGAGTVVTATVKNGTSPITDVMSIALAINLVARNLSIDPATNVIAAGGTLRAAIARTTGNAACKIIVRGIKRA